MTTTPVPVGRRPARMMLRLQGVLDRGGDFDGQLQAVLELLCEQMDADAASLCLCLSAGNNQPEVSFARRGEAMRKTVLERLGLRERVLETGEPLRLDDVLREPRFQGTIEEPFGMAPRSLLAVPLRLRQQPMGLLVAARDHVRPFTQEDEEELAAAADKLAVAAENDRLLRQARRELQEREMLLDVSRRVGQTLELEEVLDQVFEALHPVVRFNAGAIFLVQSDGSLALSAQCGYPDESELLEVPEGHGLVGLALRSEHGVRVDDVRDYPDYLELRGSTRSEIAVPIRGGGETIGVINLESDQPDAYSERDLRIAELIAGQVSSAIVNARLHRNRLASSRLRHELELAREIQTGLFPTSPPHHPAIELDAINLPSSEVGGDYYDHLLREHDEIWLALADVSGHGLSAALLTGVLQTGFRLLASEHDDPAELATRLNAVLHASTPSNQFAAALLAKLDLRSGELSYCNAGHLPGYAHDGVRWTEVSGGGIPLGLFADASYETRTMQMTPGGLLLLFTDGIPEAQDSAGSELGVPRLLELVGNDIERPIGEFASAMRRRLQAHRGRRGSHADDVTMMTVRWLGPS